MDLDQPVDPPDSSQAQDVAERGTSADPEPRVLNICGLCKFRFHEGQAIITVDRSNSTLPLTWDDKYYPENEILRPYGQKAFHTGCFQIAGNVVFAKGFLESCTWNLVKFRFHYDSFTQPPPSFVARRARRLRSSLSRAIRHAIKNRLPIEVCENIAAYCLSEYATNLHLDAWQRRDPSGPNKDVTLPIFNGQTIWAQYVEIEGRNYVKSLSTARMNGNDTMAFMVKPKPNSWMGLKMYFTEDSLGVRSVIASSDDGIQSTEEPGLRWISIPSKTYNITFYIRMNFDGLKLRNLDVTQYEREHHYEQRARWAMFPRDLGYPNAPPDNIETVHGAAVHAVDWNLPGVSVPYRSGKLSPALLDAYANAGLVCLYFPVDPDERISELWLRSGDFPCDDDDALTRAESLIVATSSRRSLVLGPDIRSRSSHSNRPLNYEALADLPSTTSARTFYYKYTNTESWLGFEKTTTWHERKIKLSFGPPARPGPYDWPDRFFSTSAELENLQTINPCRGWETA
ncbi:uncharacterized protein Y057_308 [Fusarium fujikuroi]|nr:uncharacterized protein Y057_308 [Fusarium fujikuroi]